MIDSVNAYNTAHGESTNYQIDNLADCQNALLDYIEMQGMSGYAASEAAGTIEGSVAMMKAAYQNLVVGMADENANFGQLVDNFVDSAATAAGNLLPRISQTLSGIGDLITGLSPVIAKALPKLVKEVLPSLLTAAVSLITALVSGIIAAAPAVYEAFKQAIFIALQEVFGISEEAAGTFIGTIDGFIKSLVEFFKAGLEAISALFSWLVEQAQTEGTYFNMVWENIKLVVSSAVKVIEGVIKLFTAILKGDWSAAWEYCKNIASTVLGAITGIISNIVEWITGFLGTMVEKGFELINSLAEGIQNKFAELFTLVGGWVTDNIINPIADMGEDLYNAGVNLLNRFWDGLVSVWDKITKWWDKLKLSDKEANVRVNRDDDDGDRYATGLNYVPYDDFPAFLHRGEAVLTAAEARVWRNGGQGTTGASGVIINQYIQSVPQTPVEFADTTAAYFEQARWAL